MVAAAGTEGAEQPAGVVLKDHSDAGVAASSAFHISSGIPLAASYNGQSLALGNSSHLTNRLLKTSL